MMTNTENMQHFLSFILIKSSPLKGEDKDEVIYYLFLF
ncbi:hypothetical protein J699_02847 [Acinetobacter sp. 1000160]|nr:hypothetical protein J522_3207 [Acinetobacter baumannii 146457]EYT16944.1 hypothetical protein J699_02847 [Acinetobacter sp. 1000160]